MGAGICLPPGVCQSVRCHGELLAQISPLPQSESPKCLEVGGAVEWDGWARVRIGGAGSWPALPAHLALRTCPLPGGPPPGPCLPEAPQCRGWGSPGEVPAACLPLPQQAPLLLVPGGCIERVMWTGGCQGLPFLPQTHPEARNPTGIPPSEEGGRERREGREGCGETHRSPKKLEEITCPLHRGVGRMSCAPPEGLMYTHLY